MLLKINKTNEQYMTPNQKIEDAVRHAIIAHPDAILDDKDVMHALIAANEKIMGANIVDLRGITMDRLETRLDRLEETHRSVIAAAYENVAGTNQIHRAVLRLLEAGSLAHVLRDLNDDIARTLRVDVIRLVIEGDPGTVDATSDVLALMPDGYVDAYLSRGRAGSTRAVTLRQLSSGDADLYGMEAVDIRSEACLKLDLGWDRLPGLLVLGSQDPHMFSPQQGTDLLAFFADVMERVLRRLLA